MKEYNNADLELKAKKNVFDVPAPANSWQKIKSSHSIVTLDIETAPLDVDYLERYEEMFPRQLTDESERYRYLFQTQICPAQFQVSGNRVTKTKTTMVQDPTWKPAYRSHDLDSPALHWTTGRVVCLGLKFDAEPPMTIIRQDETDILSEAWELLKRDSATFCTFNGKKFDFPFLFNRANALGVEFNLPTDWKRHIDIFDHPHVGGKWGTTVPSLARMAFAYGLSNLLVGSGSEVSSWWENKEWSKIAAHNCGDLETTYAILRRGAW